jgi:hypothetical protein
MRSTRYLIAVLLLILSEQSMASFIPGGVQVITAGAVVSNDVGC